MKFEENLITFNLPGFLANPVLAILIGLLAGVILGVVISLLFKGDSKKTGAVNYQSKADSLASLSTNQIVSRTRSIIDVVRGLYKINDAQAKFKPINSNPVINIKNSAVSGTKYVLSSDVDFFEIIGNWTGVKKELENCIVNIEHYSRSQAINNEEYRKFIISEIRKCKETLESES